MTTARRAWIRTFQQDPAALRAVLESARSCMADACERHEAEDCECEDQRMTPLEFAEWVEAEVRRAGTPIRLFERQPVATIRTRPGANLASAG